MSNLRPKALLHLTERRRRPSPAAVPSSLTASEPIGLIFLIRRMGDYVSWETQPVTRQPTRTGNGKSRRILLAMLGFGGFTAGIVAVFLSTATVGVVALLAIGAVLFAAGVLDLSPRTVKVGDNEVQLEHTLYAERTQKAVAGVLNDQTTSVEQRETLSELIVRLNEQFADEVGAIPDSARKLALNAYITAVHGALRRTVPREYEIQEFDETSDLSFVIKKFGSSDLHVDCAIGIKTAGEPMPAELVKYYIGVAREKQRLLVVTNRPPSNSIYEEAPSQGFRKYSELEIPIGLEIVGWTSAEDDVKVSAALRRLLKVGE
jgi:hypothetical protein